MSTETEPNDRPAPSRRSSRALAVKLAALAALGGGVFGLATSPHCVALHLIADERHYLVAQRGLNRGTRVTMTRFEIREFVVENDEIVSDFVSASNVALPRARELAIAVEQGEVLRRLHLGLR